MKKTISLIILLIVMLFALSGCANVKYSTTINKDGSGDIVYIYTINKAVINNLGKNNENATASMREKAEKAGYTVEDHEDEEMVGFKALKNVQDITKKPYLLDVFDKYIQNGEDSKIKIKNSLFGKTYSQSVIVNSKDLEQLEELGGKIQYTINIPIKVGKTNADIISADRKTLTWDIRLGQEQEIYFKATSGIIYFWIFIIIVAIIAIFILYKFVFKNYKKDGKEKKNKDNQSID